MARRNRVVGFACATAGLLLAAASVAGGCGGSESSGSPTEDTGGATDTGVADTTKPDTTPAETKAETEIDTAKEYDAPGSLFDVVIPDVVFDGDVTASGCYDCTLSKCHDQVATCDKDVRCRGTLLCILTTCSSFSDFTCALGCAGEYDVAAGDPILATLLGIGSCVRSNCSAECPALPGGGDGGTGDAVAEAPSDGGSSEASSGEVGPGEAGPIFHPPSWQSSNVDPHLAEALLELQATFAGSPELRQGLVDHLKSSAP